ncbi:MAG TPA: tetratricopeptide repeat protein, partial [Rhodocyclaceae bacterium]|nr:tetratricopeptide repeat protein [Rhodocyclaceae bacterium]
LSRLPGLEPGQLVAVGRLQLDAGAFREASASAEKALARNAGLVPAQILQIESEMALGDLNRADALLKSFATRSGNSAEALRLAGDLARARQQPRDAARLYRSAFDKAPSLALVLRGVETSFQAGEGDRAVSLLDTWLRTHPNDLTARSALAESHFRLGHLADARRLYEGVLVAEPANANVANNLAQILMALNDPGALNAAEAAYRLAPGDANVLDTVGWARARSGALDIGLKALREARLRAPESREIRYHLAWVLLRKGLRDEARAELQGALNSTNGSGYDIEIQNLRRELGV